MERTRIAAAAVALLLGAVACSTETQLTVQAQGENAEGETVPLTNVQLDILPYDIDALYEELEGASQPGDPPVADSLRALSQTYQDVCTAYRATGDSIETVRQQATAITDQTSDAYNQAFSRYQTLVQREEERFARCQAVTDTYTQVRNEYRGTRQDWEERAWPTEEFNAAELELIADKAVQSIETDANGAASVTVANGTWWILGTSPIPGSISQQYRWNVRVDAAGGEQEIQLTGENAELQPVF